MARYLRTMVAALAATTITGADANAAWTATFPVSAPAGIAELPQVAVAPSGVATVVWTRYEGSEVAVHARRVDPGGGRAWRRADAVGAGRDRVQPGRGSGRRR